VKTASTIDIPRVVNDQVLHETTETAQSGIIKWYGLRSDRVYRRHGLYPITVDVVQPGPCCKMRLCGIKQMLHDFLDVRRHVPKLGMVDPVPRGIRGEEKVSYGVSVDFFIELEEDTEAGVRKDGMCRFGEDVIVRKTLFGCCKSLRCQELLHGKMRELYNLAAFPIDDGDESRTYGHHRFFCVFWAPRRVKCRGRCLVELNCKNLCEFFNTKRANRHHKTLEESLCVFSFLPIDGQQCTAICFVQCHR
jgi:hypothetical protein